MSHHQIILRKEAQMKEYESKAATLYKQIKQMRRHHKLTCSDHAVVRYQERVKLLPVGQVLSELLSEKVQRYYNELGDGTYPTGESTTRVVIKSGVIVTVLI